MTRPKGTKQDDLSLRTLIEDEGGEDDLPVDASIFDEGGVELEPRQTRRNNGRFLGMTAAERAFLSVMILLNVLVLGVGVLIVTGRIAF